MEYYLLFSVLPLTLLFAAILTEQYGKKSKRKLRRLKRKLKMQEKGDCGMSKIIDGLVGKKCKMPIYGIVTILEADDEWLKFEYEVKKGVKAVKVKRIDELNEFEIRED